MDCDEVLAEGDAAFKIEGYGSPEVKGEPNEDSFLEHRSRPPYRQHSHDGASAAYTMDGYRASAAYTVDGEEYQHDAGSEEEQYDGHGSALQQSGLSAEQISGPAESSFFSSIQNINPEGLWARSGARALLEGHSESLWAESRAYKKNRDRSSFLEGIVSNFLSHTAIGTSSVVETPVVFVETFLAGVFDVRLEHDLVEVVN